MSKCRWVNYILILIVTITLFSQQLKINSQTEILETVKNESLNLTTFVKVNSEIITQLVFGQMVFKDNLDLIKKYTTSLIENQLTIIKFIKRNVDIKPVFSKLRLATAEVKVGRAGGTGTIIKITDKNLYILTARHVVDCSGTVDLQVTDSKTLKFIRINNISRANIHKSKYVDMAVIIASKPKGEFISLDLAKKRPNIGTKIYTVGHPLSLHYTFQTGIVSNYTKRIFGDNKRVYMMVSAPAFNGNSGGACVNTYNEIVGIVVGIAYIEQEVGFDNVGFYLTHLVFVVTIDEVNKFMEKIENEISDSK